MDEWCIWVYGESGLIVCCWESKISVEEVLV